MVETRISNSFLTMKHSAKRLDDNKNYNINSGEFNPEIVKHFCNKYVNKNDILWEPFAGHTNLNKTFIFCEEKEIKYIGYDICSNDVKIEKKNSIVEYPKESVRAVVFHPPYYGSSPFSNEYGEISGINSFNTYIKSLNSVIENISKCMFSGNVCVVGRSVLVKKERYALDWIFSKLFIDNGFEIKEVISSVPDWVVILGK
jgi:hypothetical protein